MTDIRLPEPFNAHAFLVEPSSYTAPASIPRRRLLQPSEIRWTHYRNGGSGRLEMTVEGVIDRASDIIRDEWEIVLEVRLETETEYSTWYRGIIYDVERRTVGTKAVSTIRALGYFHTYMRRIVLDKDDTTGTADVKTLVTNVFTASDGVTGKSRILWDASGVDASTYTPTDFDIYGSSSRAVRVLAELQGSREFDIDPSTRKFRMAATSSTVAERNIYILGKNIHSLRQAEAFPKGTTRIEVQGHPRFGSPQTVSRADASSESTGGQKSLQVLLPEMSATADLNRWVDNHLTDLKAKAPWAIFEVENVVSRVEGSSLPVGKIEIRKTDLGQVSDRQTYPLHKVEYRIGLACAAEYETPDCTPEETRPRGYSFSATVYCGEPPPDLPEVFERVEREKDATHHFIHRNQIPRTGTSLPTVRLWDGQLFLKTDTEALYEYDSGTAAWKLIASTGAGEGPDFTSDVTITKLDPCLKLINTTAGEDDFEICAIDGGLQIKNTTDARQDVFITGAGKIGVGGQNAPDSLLHVFEGSAGLVAAPVGSSLTVESNGAIGGIGILVPDASEGRLMFGSPTDDTGALLSWKYNDHLLKIGTSDPTGSIQFLAGNLSEAGGVTNDGRLYWTDNTASDGILAHANTADRTYTYPDSSFTVAGQNIDNAFSVDQTISKGSSASVVGPTLRFQDTGAGAADFEIGAKQSELLIGPMNWDPLTEAPYFGIGTGGDPFFFSGTSYKGTLAHGNTADRTYSFPDATSDVALEAFANVFTLNQTLQGTEPTLIFDNTTASSDDYHIRNKVLASSNLEIYNATDARIDFQILGNGDIAIGDVTGQGGVIYFDQSAASVGIGVTSTKYWAKAEVLTSSSTALHVGYEADGGVMIGYLGNTIQGRGGSGQANNVNLRLNYFGGNVSIGVIGASGAQDMLDVVGDLRATGGFKHSFTFSIQNLAANQTDAYLAAEGSAGTASVLLPYAGSVMAIGVASNEARTAGTATFKARVNTVDIGLSAALNATNTTKAATTQAKDTDTFAALDTLEVTVTTSSDWAPTTADVLVTVVIEM